MTEPWTAHSYPILGHKRECDQTICCQRIAEVFFSTTAPLLICIDLFTVTVFGLLLFAPLLFLK